MHTTKSLAHVDFSGSQPFAVDLNEQKASTSMIEDMSAEVFPRLNEKGLLEVQLLLVEF